MKKALEGSGGMLPRKIFEKLRTAVAILVLFEQILGIFCLNYLPLTLSVAPNMMHFVRRPYFFDYASLGRKAYCYRKGSKLWKNCIHQKHV